MKIELNLSDLLDLIQENPEVTGKTEDSILGIASLDNSQKGDLTFVQDKKNAQKVTQCKATVLLAPKELKIDAPQVDVIIRVDNPSRALSQVCSAIEQTLFPKNYTGIHSSAVITDSTKLGDNVSVGAFTVVEEEVILSKNCHIGNRVTIGANSSIGENTVIMDNVVLAPHTRIGEGSIIHSGVVLGCPGFGYDFNKDTGIHEPIPQIGSICIGNNVEIGANTTIDRARFGVTQIGDGTKIDNQVQIAHNVIIGKHCIVCAMVGISGSVNIGDYVVLAGGVGIADHIDIASKTQIGGGAAVISSIKEPGSKLWGIPAVDFGLALKISILQKRLPDLFKRFKVMEEEIKSIQDHK